MTLEGRASSSSSHGELACALEPLATSVDHIGSISIPGMAAKDCVDIHVRCQMFDAVLFDKAFDSVGYVRSNRFPAKNGARSLSSVRSAEGCKGSTDNPYDLPGWAAC